MKKIIKIMPEQFKIPLMSIYKLDELVNNQYLGNINLDKKSESLAIGTNNNNEIKSSLCESDTEYE
ncbi:hypothetical protein QJ854_gp864 [Moumouvirus goulette]|uniref:Uncharacterized protein n=1 Tax=Moumouvirus goulette TaxID=1247379 RepID=M1PG27_9VIRU|nr:hypothetical protein QJ854_gp864 [Moumouvirus goulette]AGF84918.1 hypothetical protein glt_00109 [Moumouvirus goulette]